MLNPYSILAALLILLATNAGSYWLGGSNARNACAADNGKAAAKVEKREDRRDQAVDTIGADTRQAVNTEQNLNRSKTDESAHRIRTVVVPGNCRAVDPAVVRELQQAADDANAALRSGL